MFPELKDQHDGATPYQVSPFVMIKRSSQSVIARLLCVMCVFFLLCLLFPVLPPPAVSLLILL